MRLARVPALAFLVFVAGALGVACSNGTEPSGGGGGGGGGTTVDVSGTWNYTLDVTVANGVCAGEEFEDDPPPTGTGPEMGSATVVQSGTTVTATSFWGSDDGMTHDLTGTISGSTVTVTGTYPEDGGMTTRTLILTANTAVTMMTGVEEWTWTDGVDTCADGEATVTATKQ